MTWSISLSGINAAFPNAVIYSWSDSFWSSLMSFWKNAFNSFYDSYYYYFFDSFTFSVVLKFVAYFGLLFGVAFVSSLVFGWWFWSRSWISWRIHDSFTSK